jgi:hypothetical protein
LTALDYLPVFEGRAREIRRKYEAGGSLAAVYQELRGARIEVPVRTPEQIRARLVEALSVPRIGPLAKALFGEDAEARWPALLAGLDAAAQSRSTGAGAFRLPLADEPPSPRQLQLWTLLLNKAAPAGAGPSGVLYRTGGEVPCGVVFFRDVRPEDVLLFHPAAAPTDFVEEIPPPVVRRSAPEEEASPPAAIAAGPPGEAASPAAIATAPAAEAALQVESAPPVAAVPPEEAASPEEPPRPETEAVAAGPPESPPGAAPAEVPAAEAPIALPTPPDAEAAVSPESAATLPEPPVAEPKAPTPAGWDLPLATLLGSD